MTVSDRAVRKASGERLLRDFRQAASDVALFRRFYGDSIAAHETLFEAGVSSSRTKYACLMTAFGQ